jgi:hypothetical protein
MFQYAVGRAIAHRRGTTLALDVSAFPDCRHRQYALGVFKIVENFAEGAWLRRGRLGGLRRRLRPNRLRERSFTFDPTVLEAPDGVYLEGYWQSEKYFKEIEDIIRREFCFKSGPEGQNAEMAERIKGVVAVAVHVRRGDGVPEADRLHGVLPPDYYHNAARLIASQVSRPHFFVFSNEPSWTRSNLKLDGPTTFLAQNGIEKGHEDLRLMGLCRHHIIPNSTFSWWGAWLSNSGGIVVAPKKWFSMYKYDTRDLIPQTWARL